MLRCISSYIETELPLTHKGIAGETRGENCTIVNLQERFSVVMHAI